MYNKFVTKLFFLIAFIFSIIIVSICTNRKIKLINSQKNSEKLYRRKLNKDLSNLKKITFIKNVFNFKNKHINNKNHIFIYNDGCCKGCVRQGKKLIHKIDTTIIYILNLTKKRSNDYKELKTYAKNNNIDYYLNKINYIKTPVIIKFDSLYNVIDAFFPGLDNDSEFKKFIE